MEHLIDPHYNEPPEPRAWFKATIGAITTLGMVAALYNYPGLTLAFAAGCVVAMWSTAAR